MLYYPSKPVKNVKNKPKTAFSVRICSLFLVFLMLFSLVSCFGDPDDLDDGETVETTGDAIITGSVEDIPTQEYIDSSVYPIDHAGAKTEIVLKASDYGVKGDGKTNDGPAIDRAITDTIAKQATLQFDSGKTYLVTSTSLASTGFATPFSITNEKGITIDGGGSLFKFKPGLSFISITGSADIRLANMRFDYTVSPYLVGTVKSVSGSKVTFTTDIEPFANSYDYSDLVAFSIMHYSPVQHRPHQFISSMKKTASKEVTVTYKSASHGYKAGNTVYLPNPGIGHVFGNTVNILGCSGALTLENIQIHASSSFVCAIKSNNAEIYFENVDLVPSEDNNRAIKMVSWRDGFHCKDNRLPFHWNECDVDILFDDVFNISGTLGYVTSVSNNAKISVVNYEFQQQGINVSFGVQKGDVIDVYDPKTGTFCGTATVREVNGNADQSTTIVLDYGDKLKQVKEGCVVGNRETCAPGSTITNCRFTGTYRLLRNIRVENTVFDQLATWIKVEGGVEGPLPGDIDFIDCTFKGGTLEIGIDQGQIAKEIKNIGFWNCTFEGVTKSFSTGCKITTKKTWSEETLFTQLARKKTTVPTEIKPTALDLQNGIYYEWDEITMAVDGGVFTTADSFKDEGMRNELNSNSDFNGRVLTLTGTKEQTRFVLSGFDIKTASLLHRKNATHLITFDYYIASSANVKIGAVTGEDGKVIKENVFSEMNLTSRALVLYTWENGNTGLYIDVPEGVTVVIGKIGVATASNAQPTMMQLENGHTFHWGTGTNGVTIGTGGKAMAIDKITDAAAKNAIQGAKSGFTSGTVLHINGALGEFSGLTDASYYTPGETYRISIDAYIASAMVPASGTKIYLLALDSTAGNRIIASDLFKGEGLYHFETDYTVGANGEYALSFYISNKPKAYADLYIGDFTFTKAVPQNPSSFSDREDYHTLTKNEAKEGYTFDFTEGNLADTGLKGYVDINNVPRKTRTILTEAGFGETVYYANCNFSFHCIPNGLINGKKLTITMQIYDVKGNLATSGDRGAFVLLNMTKGVQNSAEVNYTLKRSQENERVYTMTFTFTPHSGTDQLLVYGLTSFEFYIGQITVKRG